MNYEDRVTKTYIENALANAGPKIVTGTYTGDGSATRSFSLGFTPKALYVCLESGGVGSSYTYCGGLALAGHPVFANQEFVLVEITSGGFTVHNKLDNPYCYYINANTWVYHYVAIG